MKILELKLIAFGSFTDKHLDFGNGRGGFYIVYGDNEAGKSCALRALRDLLYGIPTRSTDNFIHPHSKMRIGGTLRRDDGTILEFIRRKGINQTLRASDDATVLDESQLRTFLGGVDESLFATIFGIDHADLVKGGEEIIQGGGDIGQVLFAAGSGISDLRSIQNEFQAESDALFLPSGKKPRINEDTGTLKKKQKAIREAQLPGQEWVRHDMALSEALEQKKSVDQDLEKQQREQHRLKRIKEALPAIGRRKELLKDLETCIDAVILSADFSDLRQDLIKRLGIAESMEKPAVESLEAIHKALGKLNVPEQLLSNADTIEEIYQDLGRLRKDAKDRSKLEILQSGLDGDAKTILQDLRDDLTLDQADRLRLGKTETVRIQELGNQYERLITRFEAARKEKEKLTSRLDSLNKQLAELKEQKDTGELRKTIERILQQGVLEENYKTLCNEIQRAEQNAEITLKKQTLWTGPVESFETLPVPSLETIDTFELRLGDAESEVKHQRADLEELQRSIIEIDGQIEQLRLEQEVPTEEDLNRGRKKRDEGWQLVLKSWKEKQEPGRNGEKFVAAFPLATGLADAYELSVQHADELADRLRREADRVAKKATLLADRQMREIQSARLKEQLESTKNELAKINAEWAAEWKAIEVSPKSPREMRTWAQNQAILAGRVADIREQKAKTGELQARIETLRRDLSQCLVVLGESPALENETLTNLLDRSQKLADQMDKARIKREQLFSEQAQCEEELREVTSRVEKTEKDLARWRSQWSKAILPLGLKEDSTPAQAFAVLEELKDLFGKLKEAEELRKRIQGIGRDAEAFNNKVAPLVTNNAPELSEHTPEQAAAELHVRLTRARTEKTRQHSLEKQKQQEEEKLKAAGNSISEIKVQLATMCQEAGCKSYDDLPAAEKRSEHRQDVQTELKQLEDQLRKLSAGLTIDEFVRDALSVDSDSIDPALDRLGEEIDRLWNRKSELDKTIGREENELSKMDGSARAADLAEEAQGLIARLETDVQQYIRLRIASEILNKAIESYREKNQGPILERSSDLFARITPGSFAGLQIDFNDKGDAVLMGVRPEGRGVVGVEGMSDGTADQLYLAVRLASLESYLEKNEDMPFIVDDVLIHFDNERAAATLQILAQLAQKTQIIFFTHHQHLVELARAHVDKDVLFVHSLSPNFS